MNMITTTQGHAFYTLVQKTRKQLIAKARKDFKCDIASKIQEITKIRNMDSKEVFKAFEVLIK